MSKENPKFLQFLENGEEKEPENPAGMRFVIIRIFEKNRVIVEKWGKEEIASRKNFSKKVMPVKLRASRLSIKSENYFFGRKGSLKGNHQGFPSNQDHSLKIEEIPKEFPDF